MPTMPLVQIHNVDTVAIDQVPIPEAGVDDVLIKVAYCGICGSDLGYIAMGGLLGPGTPMPLGHELSGTIEKIGNNVKHLKLGDRVVVNPEGNNNRIGNSGPEGAFSPYLLVRGVVQDENCILPLPDSLSLELAALVEPLSVAMHAVKQSDIQTKDKVVIFGGGPIGLGIVLVLRHYGINNIIVIDLSETRCQMAEQLGANSLCVKPDELSAQLQQYQGSADLMGTPLPDSDVYFEATGVGSVFNQAVNCAKRGARLVVVGVHKTPVKLDLVNVLMRELHIVGSMAYTDEFSHVIEMLTQCSDEVLSLISQRYPLSQFSTALATAQNTHKAIKVMIDCQA